MFLCFRYHALIGHGLVHAERIVDLGDEEVGVGFKHAANAGHVDDLGHEPFALALDGGDVGLHLLDALGAVGLDRYNVGQQSVPAGNSSSTYPAPV